MWIVCITSVRHVLTVNGYGGRQTKENEKSWCFKGWETLVINMTIKGQNYKLKYTLRALFIYEQITGKAFELKTITDEYLFFYCVLLANNPDSSLTFEELIESIDEDMSIMLEFQNFLKKELEKQQLFITNNSDAKKKS